MKKKTAAILSVIACLLVAAGATIAWLTDTTAPVKNTFTVGNIDIDLAESNGLDLKMVPGKELTKDPAVTVEKDSEACWLFVKAEKSDNFDTFMTYAIADGWTALTGQNGVYYREVSASNADQDFTVIKDNKVTVKDTVTKDQLDALTTDTYPTLTFTAYAVQKEKITTAADAWAKL